MLLPPLILGLGPLTSSYKLLSELRVDGEQVVVPVVRTPVLDGR